jgi:hypothetical protein
MFNIGPIVECFAPGDPTNDPGHGRSRERTFIVRLAWALLLLLMASFAYWIVLRHAI